MPTVIESDLSLDLELLPKDTEEAKAAILTDEDLVKEPESSSDSGVDGALSDGEDESLLSFKLRHPRLLAPSDNLKERSKKARKRYLQHLAYTQFMEDRMLDIERRLKVIEAVESPPETPKTTSKRPDEISDISLDIKRMTFAEYAPMDPTPQRKSDEQVTYSTPHEHKPRHAYADQTPYSLIDVVYADERPAPAQAPTRLEITPTEAPSVQPDRVRINSPLLLKALGRISGHRFLEIDFDGKFLLLSQVMLRPFKFFVAYEQKIREELKRLESLNSSYDYKSELGPQEVAHNSRLESAQLPIDHSIMSEPNDSGSRVAKVDGERGDQIASMSLPTDYKSKNLDPLESKRCFEELEVLRKLLDGDLRPVFELRKQLEEGTARSIFFQDLWHLYTLGAEVVSNSADGQRQIFRVVETRGGRPFLCGRYAADMEPFEAEGPHDKDLPKFEILAHTYESDGKVLGMCQLMFTIKRYEGKKAITSLPCYPISYASDLSGLSPRDFFIARGKRYVELTRSDHTVHKRYDGLTLFMHDDEELREEVVKDRILTF